MPQINMYGSGGNGPNDPRAIRAAAFDKHEARQARFEKGYTGAERQEAARQQRRDDAIFRAQESARRSEHQREQRDAADYFRQQQAAERRQEQAKQRWERVQRSDDRRQERTHRAQWNDNYRLAAYENGAHNDRLRRQQRLQREQDRAAKQQYSNDYKLATYQNQNLNAQQRAADRAAKQHYNDDYRLAMRENADVDARKRQDRMNSINSSPIMRALGFIGGSRVQRAASAMLSRGGGDEGGGMGFGGIGRAAPYAAGAYLAYRAAKAIAFAPQTLSAVSGRMANSAQPYIDLRMGAAGLGRQGGFEHMDLVHSLFPRNGETPGWMKSRGITPQGGISALQAYGLPISGAREGRTILEEMHDARNMPYLGGMEPEAYGKMLGTANTLGTSLPGGARMTGREGQNREYFRELQKTMYAANLASLDHSQVLGTIETLTRMTATLGTSGPSVGGANDLWWKMASGGSAGGRTGESALNAAQANASFAGSAGFGGNVGANTMMHAYFARNGRMPKTREDLEKHLGVKYDDLSATDKRAFDDALSAAKDGNEAAFFSLLAPFTGNPTTGVQLMQKWASQSGLTGGKPYMHTLTQSGFTGQSTYTVQQYESSNAYPQLQEGSPRNMNLPRGIRNNNPLNLSYRNDQGALGSDGRFGYYRTMEEGVAAGQRQLMTYNDKYGLNTIRGIITRWAPPGENDTEGYIKMVSERMGVSPDAPLNIRDQTTAEKLIGAMVKKETGTEVDPAAIHQGVSMGLGGAPGGSTPAAGNNTGDIYGPQATQGQIDMQAGRQAFETYSHGMMVAGESALKFSAAVANSTDALGKFVEALKNGTTALGGSSGRNWSDPAVGGNAPGGPIYGVVPTVP